MDIHWRRTTRYLTLIFLIAFGLWLLATIRPLIGPLVIAGLLAYVLSPAVGQVQRRTPLARRGAVVLVYVLFLAVLAVGVAQLAPILARQAAVVSGEFQALVNLLEHPDAPAVTLFDIMLPVDELLLELRAAWRQILQPARAFRVIAAATANLALLLTTLLVTYYLLQDWPRLRDWLIRLAPEPYQADAQRLYAEIAVLWQAYLRGQLLLMTLVGLASSIAAMAIGVPGALLIGLVAGALDLIPSLGPLIAMLIAAAAAWTNGSTTLPLAGPTTAVLVLIVFGAIQTVENVWWRPRILGRQLSLHPAVVFVGVVGALMLSGTLLALIIVPLIGSAGVLGRYLWARTFGHPPWPSPDAGEPTPDK